MRRKQGLMPAGGADPALGGTHSDKGANGETPKKLLRSHTARYIDPTRFGRPAMKISREQVAHPKFVQLRSFFRSLASYVQAGALTVAQWENLCTLWVADSVQRYPAGQRIQIAGELSRLSLSVGAGPVSMPPDFEFVAAADAASSSENTVETPATTSACIAEEEEDSGGNAGEDSMEHVTMLCAAGFDASAVRVALANTLGNLPDAVAALLLLAGALPGQEDGPLSRAPSAGEEARGGAVAEELEALAAILAGEFVQHPGEEGIHCTLRLPGVGAHDEAHLEVMVPANCMYPDDPPLLLVRCATVPAEGLRALTREANAHAAGVTGGPMMYGRPDATIIVCNAIRAGCSLPACLPVCALFAYQLANPAEFPPVHLHIRGGCLSPRFNPVSPHLSGPAAMTYTYGCNLGWRR